MSIIAVFANPSPLARRTGAASGAGFAGTGLVPGVEYPAHFQDTTPELVAQRIAVLPEEIGEKFEEVLRAEGVSASMALGFLKAWADAAWGSLEASKAAHEDVLRQAARMTSPDAPLEEWMPEWWGDAFYSTPLGFNLHAVLAGQGLDLFFARWREANLDWRQKWDVRHAPKEALRAYLRALPADELISDEARYEMLRQAESYASLALTIERISREDYAAQLASIVEQRGLDATFEESLGFGLEVMGRWGRKALEFAFRAGRAVLKELAPWWVWAILGVGAVGIVTTAVRASAPVRVVREVRESVRAARE